MKRAESELEELDTAKREILRKLFLLCLIQPGEGTEDTRRRATKQELLAVGGNRTAAEEVLQRWTDARLLTTRRERGMDLVEVSHEALIRRWDRVRNWMAESNAVIRLVGTLRRAATDWNHIGRRPDFLFQGSRLVQMEEILKRHGRDLTELERRFVEEGVAQRKRRRHKELRIARTVHAITLLILVVVGYLAVNWRFSEGLWRAQSARNYGERSRTLRDQNHLLRSLHFSAEALVTNPDKQLKEKILAGIDVYQPNWSLINILEHESDVFGAVLDPSGMRILTWSMDGTAKLWDSATGDSIGIVLRHRLAVVGASFDRAGKRIITASTDGTARIWNAESGEPVGKPLVHQDWVNGVTFSNLETTILTWSNDGTARLWSVDNHKPIGIPMRHGGSVRGATFDSSDQRVLTWSEDGTARIWNARNCEPVGEPMTHKDIVDGAVFDSSEERILTWSHDGTAQLWDAHNGNSIGEPMRHDGMVHRAKFDASENRILTTGGYSASLWDARSGEPIGEPFRHNKFVNGGVFSKSGIRILTWSSDRTAQIWYANTGEPIGAPLTHELAVMGATFGSPLEAVALRR